MIINTTLNFYYSYLLFRYSNCSHAAVIWYRQRVINRKLVFWWWFGNMNTFSMQYNDDEKEGFIISTELFFTIHKTWKLQNLRTSAFHFKILFIGKFEFITCSLKLKQYLTHSSIKGKNAAKYDLFLNAYLHTLAT